MVDIYDEPSSDSPASATCRVCELARKQVKNALSGNDGDGLFAGYRRYRFHMAEQVLRDKIPTAIPSSDAYLNSMSQLREDERQGVFSTPFKEKLNGHHTNPVFKRR